jgi:hypothetical protein
MDIFRDYFTREQLLQSIAKAQYVPGRLAEFFTTRALNSTTLALEDMPKNGPTLVTKTARGAPSRVASLEKAAVHTFETSHYRVDGSVYADEVLNMRASGNAMAAVEIIQQRRDALIARMRSDIDMTHESLRMACLSTPTNAFGTVDTEQTINFNTDETKVRQEIFTKIIKRMESALDGIPFSGIHALCEDTLWAKIIEHPAITKTWLNWNAAQGLRADPREMVNFGGVTWERVRGITNVTIPSGKARIIPLGVADLFVQAFAPADTLDTVGAGALGTPYYPQALPSADNRRWYLEIQTNPVMVCTRPYAVLQLASN